MKLQTKSTFGNFAITAWTEADDDQRDALANLGLLQILQRSPASAAEKAMAGYEKRPSGFKRDSIPFNAENASLLKAAMEEPIKLDEEGNVVVACHVEVVEYIPTAADVKMNDERKAYERNAGKLDKLAAKVGYDGQVGSGKADEAPVEFLRAIRAWTNAQLAALDAE